MHLHRASQLGRILYDNKKNFAPLMQARMPVREEQGNNPASVRAGAARISCSQLTRREGGWWSVRKRRESHVMGQPGAPGACSCEGSWYDVKEMLDVMIGHEDYISFRSWLEKECLFTL